MATTGPSRFGRSVLATGTVGGGLLGVLLGSLLATVSPGCSAVDWTVEQARAAYPYTHAKDQIEAAEAALAEARSQGVGEQYPYHVTKAERLIESAHAKHAERDYAGTHRLASDALAACKAAVEAHQRITAPHKRVTAPKNGADMGENRPSDRDAQGDPQQ